MNNPAPPWVDNYEHLRDRKAVMVGSILAGNDGDVTNSCVTYEILKGRSKPYCIDIGGAQGWWTFFVKMISPNAECTVFEPNPLSYSRLAKSLKDTSGVLVLPYAVSNTHGTLSFHLEGEKSHSRNGASVPIPCVELTPFLRERVDMIKIDVEGHEPEILYTLEKHFNKIEAICFEFTPMWFSTREGPLDLLEFLAKHYPFMAHLSRRHEIKLFPLQSKEQRKEYVDFCLKTRHQTDILVCKEPIFLPDEW